MAEEKFGRVGHQQYAQRGAPPAGPEMLTQLAGEPPRFGQPYPIRLSQLHRRALCWSRSRQQHGKQQG